MLQSEHFFTIRMTHSIDIAQFTGVLAAVFSVGSFFLPKHHLLLIAGSISALIWGLHFYLLNQPTAVWIEILASIRMICALWCMDRSVILKTMFSCIWAAIFIANLDTQQAWIINGTLALASGIGLFSAFFLKDQTYRKALLLAEPLWFIFAYLVGSYPGMVTALLGATFNLVMLKRMNRISELQPSPKYIS